MEKKRAREQSHNLESDHEFDAFGEWVYKYPKGSISVREHLLPKMKPKRKKKRHSLAFVTAAQLLRMQTKQRQARERQRARREKKKKDSQDAEDRHYSQTSAF